MRTDPPAASGAAAETERLRELLCRRPVLRLLVALVAAMLREDSDADE